MMLSDFFALVSPPFSGRAYPVAAPATPVAPYLTYFRIFASEGLTLEKNGGTGNEINTRLQVDIWAKTYGEAQTKATQVKALLKDWACQNTVQSEQDLQDEETKLFRVLLDLSIWHY